MSALVKLNQKTPPTESFLSAPLAGFIMLMLAGTAAVLLSFSAADAQRWVMHTVDVRQVNLRLLNVMQAAESGERGFLLTTDARYLTRFQSLAQKIPQLIEQLRTLTLDNPEQTERIVRLRTLCEAKLQELQETISLMQQGDGDAVIAAVRAHLLKNLMDEITGIGEQIDQQENALLNTRSAKAAVQRVWLVVAILVALALASILAYLVIVSLRRHVAHTQEAVRQMNQEMRAREATEAQLRQAQKMEALGQLTGGVAHDFNNMLAVIVGNLDMLQRSVSDVGSRTARLLDSAMESAGRASQLTHRLLAFSRLQPLAPKPIDVNKSVLDFSEVLRRTLGEHIVIETVQAAGLWLANIDLPQLESALLNLALNARDAMSSGGKLTIEMSNTYLDHVYVTERGDVKAGQYVMVAITDTGAGMAPEVLAKAFEPFFTTKPTGAGTGLGLSQVHGFMKQSGGHVQLYSEPSMGTTVKLYMPRFEGSLHAAPRTVPLQKRLGNPHLVILVVEDEEGVRKFVVDAIEELGYGVLSARNASAALHLLETHPEINLMLTDVVMPDINGRKLADSALSLRPDLKVLYMTGYTRNAVVHNGVLDSGINLLTKPFTLAQLDLELRKLLDMTA